MNGDIVAGRYAQALFALGREKGGDTLEKYGAIMAQLGDWMRTTPELVRLFKAPVITAAEKGTIVTELLNSVQADTTIHHFCLLLADKERLGLLGDIAAVFGRLVDNAEGLVRGKLATAVALDEKRRVDLVKKLEKSTRRKLALSFEVDPSLLGGVVLTVGDKVLDASLKAQVNSLKDTIKRGE